MYLSLLKIWNFRKYGQNDIDEAPSLEVEFNEHLNVLIGENDSGKTAILDAIKHVLLTKSHEYYRIEENDFYNSKDNRRANILKIECIFKGFTSEEAANFLEWGLFNKEKEFELAIRLIAERKENNRIITNIKAGKAGADIQLDGNARELLRVTYLKPLRDAEAELTPGQRSRLAQILKNHPNLQHDKDVDGNEKAHTLEKITSIFNYLIKQYFEKDKLKHDSYNQFINELLKDDNTITEDEKNKLQLENNSRTAKDILKNINNTLENLFPVTELDNYKGNIRVSENNLSSILHRLSLLFDENKSGLGALNLLFIATEFLLLNQENTNGLHLALIEELEAHIHPQAQLQVIKYLENQSEEKGQFILTTHSTTLGASIKLDNLILCNENKAFPLKQGATALHKGDYKFLERFLDTTKANLFFAKGVILVEGDAENLLLPTVAEVIDRPLHKYRVSIVNVGNIGFLRYARIFLRQDSIEDIGIKVSVVTDLDVRPLEYYSDSGNKIKEEDENKTEDEINTDRSAKFENKNKKYSLSTNIQAFIAPNWTLEYDIARSDLNCYLTRAIEIAKKIKNKDDYNITEDNLAVEFTKIDKDKIDKLSYETYKPLLNKQASKAVTAQILAQLLIDNKEKAKEIIEAQENLKYLRDAIYHVTKPLEIDNDGKQ